MMVIPLDRIYRNVGLLPVDWLREVKLCPVITNFYSKIKIKRSQHSTEF